jgi:hypothetical protein
MSHGNESEWSNMSHGNESEWSNMSHGNESEWSNMSQDICVRITMTHVTPL